VFWSRPKLLQRFVIEIPQKSERRTEFALLDGRSRIGVEPDQRLGPVDVTHIYIQVEEYFKQNELTEGQINRS
jgi:hypothetical protein